MSIILLSSLNTFAASYFINEVSGQSNKELSSNFKVLIANAVVQEGDTIVNDQTIADYVLTPNLMKLGSSYIATLSKSKNASVISSQKMKMATVDELDTISTRLTRSVLSNQTLAASQTVDSVTKEEEKGTSVVMKAKKQFYLGFGPGRVLNLGTSETGVAYTAGYLFGLDHQFSLRVGIEGVTVRRSNADLIELNLGGQYYLTKNVQSPYVVGGITYGLAEHHIPEDQCTSIFSATICNGDREHGFGAKLGAGMHFFRSTSVNFAVEASYSASLFKINDKNPGMAALKILVLY